MADIRKKTGSKGVRYQVRYPSAAAKSGYAYKNFRTMKEARAFLQSGQAHHSAQTGYSPIQTMAQATDHWLKICEKEGLNGREPVSHYTLENYTYRISFINQYDWPKRIQDLVAPDIVAFRSWLLKQRVSRDLAGKVLATLHSVFKEMTIRGIVRHNVAQGISIRADSRYREPVTIPTRQEIVSLLGAADALANSKNLQIARTWERYRPILYLAVDSGMRPQEYLAVGHTAFDDHGVHVTRAIDGGNRSLSVPKTPAGRRYIELSPETIDMVRHYAANHSIDNPYDLIFPASNGKWLCRKNWQRRGFNVACEHAGLVETVREGKKTSVRPKFRPYDLRHFFASMLIDKETNLKRIQTLMGHTNIETTINVYGHLLEDKAQLKNRSSGLLSEIRE